MSPERPHLFHWLTQQAEIIERALPTPGKIEISGDSIVMMMSPSGLHTLIVSKVMRAISYSLGYVPGGLIAAVEVELEDAELGVRRLPDLAVVTEESLTKAGLGRVSPRNIEAVVEVVSPSNATNDLIDKVIDYGRLGIPHYMIVDPRDASITVHSTPRPEREGGYQDRTHYAFGEDVILGGLRVFMPELPSYPDREP